MRRGKIASGAFFSPDGLKLLLGGEAASSVVILENAIIFLHNPSHDVPVSWARAEAIPVATSITTRLRAERLYAVSSAVKVVFDDTSFLILWHITNVKHKKWLAKSLFEQKNVMDPNIFHLKNHHLVTFVLLYRE